MKRRKRKQCDDPENPAPAPESVRQEDGHEVKVYPKRYAEGYEPKRNVRPKRLI